MKELFAEIITIGDEILYGQITDTNSQWIATELDLIGFRIHRKISVGDNPEQIKTAVNNARKTSDLIIITGGLGPTNDDITKISLAEIFESKLIENAEVLTHLESFFKQKGKTLSGQNRQQALLPHNCQALQNHWGTAPGMMWEDNKKLIFSLPGVPFEMKNLFSKAVIPQINKHFKAPVILHKFVNTAGLAESLAAEMISEWESRLPPHIRLAYLPSYGQVRLRLTALGEDKNQLNKELRKHIDYLNNTFSEYIFGYDSETLEQAIGRILKERNLTLSVAESCTGGYISHLITSIPGSSSYFIGGAIAYHNKIKERLGVTSIPDFGAVSEQTVTQMAEGVKLRYKTDIGLATSGIAGPDGGTKEKPVGTVWIACATREGTKAKKLMLSIDRDTNIKASSMAALTLLFQSLKQNN
ncbi:MAG: competence/damage-inducible protein A [Cytophagaceae bacterium]